MAIPQDEWRMIALAAIAFMLSMFVLANEPEGGEAASWYVYLILFWAAIFIGAKGTQGITKSWKNNAFFGLILGGAFIALHTWQPAVFNLGYPKSVESVRFLIVGIIAPIGEELAFRAGLYQTLFRDNRRFGFITSTIITSLVFMAFHAYAYGLQTGAFVGAFIFGVLACWVTEKTKDISAAVVMHMAVNMFLIASPMVVVGI